MEKASAAHPARQTFAQNVRRIRRLREISQEALALDAGVSRAYVSEVERGARAVSIDIMGRISDALGTPLSDLVTPELFKDLDKGQR